MPENELIDTNTALNIINNKKNKTETKSECALPTVDLKHEFSLSDNELANLSSLLTNTDSQDGLITQENNSQSNNSNST